MTESIDYGFIALTTQNISQCYFDMIRSGLTICSVIF